MKRPLFITFEGGEGSGKTTQSKGLHEYFKSINIPCIWTREPGGTKVAEAIREVLIHNDMDVTTELLLALASRNEHLHHIILPALKAGKAVICDRFIDSSLAYQGHKSGIDKVLNLHKEVFGDIMPDMTFFIDIPVKEGLSRAQQRGGNNRFESASIETHEKLRQCFNRLVEIFPERIIKIDGLKTINEIENIIIERVKYAK
jgi:dTMP kinase